MPRGLSRYPEAMRPLFVVLAALALGCSGSTPLATFTVSREEADQSCSRIVDYCVRVSCALKNDGPIPGQAVVDLELVGPEDVVIAAHTERLELGPGDARTLQHDFTEAKLGQDVLGRCKVR